MEKKVIILGDTHFDIKEPHFSAAKEFCDWFLKQDFNNEENILIHLGDFYHHANPNPKVHELGIDFIQRMNFDKIYILAGNHDYNRSQNSYSIDPLKNIKNVELILEPKLLEIEKIKFLFLPFVYDKSDISNGKTQKEFYETYNNNEPINSDFIVHHLEDETICFGGDYNGIDLKKISNGERIGGHIHKGQKGYLGTPIITRFDERNKDSFLISLDSSNKKVSYIKVPKFLDYLEIDYEDSEANIEIIVDNKVWDSNPEQPILVNSFNIFDIKNAPSRDAAYEKFSDLNIREVFLKKNEDEIDLINESNELLSNNSIEEYFSIFCKNQKISKKIKDRVLSYLS